jgi:lipoprotein-anchoring transpeptidase ErfK/SrfK
VRSVTVAQRRRGSFARDAAIQGRSNRQQERFAMQISRWLAAASVAFAIAAATTTPQSAQAREIVGFSGSYSAGTVIVHTTEKSLHYVLGGGKALRYPVGVARAGRLWSGSTFITDKALRPTWVPPDVVRRDKPNLPSLIPGGAPNNPLGAAVMTLAGGQYAIHGTNNPGSIGGKHVLRVHSHAQRRRARSLRPRRLWNQSGCDAVSPSAGVQLLALMPAALMIGPHLSISD